MSMTSFAVAELRKPCEQGDVVQSRQLMEVLEKHGALSSSSARSLRWGG